MALLRKRGIGPTSAPAGEPPEFDSAPATGAPVAPPPPGTPPTESQVIDLSVGATR